MNGSRYDIPTRSAQCDKNRCAGQLSSHTQLTSLLLPGYNFPSIQAITPYLEPTTSGASTAWAIKTALRLQCHVSVGYPEITSGSSPARYNSAVLVSPKGKVLVNYRKSFLYYTDETWADEGKEGFFTGDVEDLGSVAMGICKIGRRLFEMMMPFSTRL